MIGFKGMGCARPTKGSMRNRSGYTFAFIARNSWKVCIVYVVARMNFLPHRIGSDGLWALGFASTTEGLIE